MTEAGAVPVSEAVAECLRVEHGRPRYGVDLDDGVIPQEAGLNERAVSFTKGCYVGQETVARLYYRGKPNRRLQGLRLSAPAEPGNELAFEDRVVGRVGERRAVAAVRADRAGAGSARGSRRRDACSSGAASPRRSWGSPSPDSSRSCRSRRHSIASRAAASRSAGSGAGSSTSCEVSGCEAR